MFMAQSGAASSPTTTFSMAKLLLVLNTLITNTAASPRLTYCRPGDLNKPSQSPGTADAVAGDTV
jgi:hypothetical protein